MSDDVNDCNNNQPAKPTLASAFTCILDKQLWAGFEIALNEHDSEYLFESELFFYTLLIRNEKGLTTKLNKEGQEWNG